MSYKEYCDKLFSVDKSNLLIASDDEKKLLCSISNPEQIKVDYEILDEHLSNYINHKGSSVFGILSGESETDPWDEYISILSGEIEDFSKYEFVQKTISSIKSKFHIYSFLFDTIILNSKEYTDNKNEQSMDLYTNSSDELKQSQKAVFDATEELKNANHLVESSFDSIQNLLPNLLTVLGIFVSIIIAVVIVYITLFLDKDINNILNSVLQLQLGKYVLSAHLLGNVMFLLMFMIARLTNRSILATCGKYRLDLSRYKKEDEDKYTTGINRYACGNCEYEKECSFAYKLRKKGNYIIGFNIAMVILYAVMYIWWIFDFYWYLGPEMFFSSPDFVGVIIIAIIMIIVAGILIKRKVGGN